MTPRTRARAYAARDPRQARGRLLLGAFAGLGTGLALPPHLGWALRAVAGWDVSALVLGGLCWWIILHHDADGTRRRAGAEDPGRNTVWALVLIASAFSLFAATFVLREAKHQPLELQSLFMGLCLLAVGGAWTLTHTSYALRYAHLFYRDDGTGGIEFPGGQRPDYFDFAYFSFTVGMCFQVSDATVSSRSLRRAVLGHAVLSFAYNTAIIAVALNVVMGLFD
jgi:uncharacterized membrane protein